MIKWFAAAAAVLCATPAAAADWYMVSTASTNGSVIFVDKGGLQKRVSDHLSGYTLTNDDDCLMKNMKIALNARGDNKEMTFQSEELQQCVLYH